MIKESNEKIIIKHYRLVSVLIYSMESESPSLKELIKENEAHICGLSSDLQDIYLMKEALNSFPYRMEIEKNSSKAIRVNHPIKEIFVSNGANVSVCYGNKKNKLSPLLSEYNPAQEKDAELNNFVIALEAFKNPLVKVQKLISPDYQWVLLEAYDENNTHHVQISNPNKQISFKLGVEKISEPFNSLAFNEVGNKFILTTSKSILMGDLVQKKVTILSNLCDQPTHGPLLNGDITKDGSKFLFVTPHKLMINTFCMETSQDKYTSLNLRLTTINHARFNPHGNIIAIATTHGVALFDIPTKQQVSLVSFPVNCLTYNNEGNILALGTDDAVYIMDYKPLAESMTLDEQRLLKELKNNPPQKVLATNYWKKIFNTISNVELKKKLNYCFNVHQKEQ